MNIKTKYGLLPGLCVFCASEGLTKEHIWPNWLKDVVPRISPKHQFQTGGGSRKQGSLKLQNERNKWGTGDIHSQKLKIVCGACNNGWMSRLQESAKAILLPLPMGDREDFNFSVDECTLLSTWATMFTMVVEFRDTESAAITYDERHSFSRTNMPSFNWHIWLGHIDQVREHEPWNFFHYGWSRLEGPDDVPYKHTSQTTTFVVGRLVFHCYSSRDPLFEPDATIFGLTHSIRPIWPPPLPELAELMGTPPPLSRNDVHRLSRNFVERIEPLYPDFQIKRRNETQ